MPRPFAAALIASLALVPAAKALSLEDATVAEVEAAYASGNLTAEQVTRQYLARISAYDLAGPRINAVITLNPKALDEARALDAERRAGKIRGPLQGIPVVLKDNFNTFDLPTTAGSQLLAGSIPPADAFVVRKLRESGAIILAKVNLSEFAGSGGSTAGADPEMIRRGRVPNGASSMGGQTRNPHDPTRGPSGSSGGTGAAVAAVFAQFGLGTDTGGSVRNPSSWNGVVGLKPTMGLMSRAGIVPLALSFDSGGPLARSVYDVALALGVMTGVDPEDSATFASETHLEHDYTHFLRRGALRGARIGIARSFMGFDRGTDAVVEQAIARLRELGAVIVDPVIYPDYLLRGKQPLYNLLVASEFKAQITDYLQTLSAGYPRTFDDLVALANDPATHYRTPGKAVGLKYTASIALDLDDPQYRALKVEQDAIKAGVAALFAHHRLDAIVYPTSPYPATPIEDQPPAGGVIQESPTALANETECPDLVVPAGMTAEGLPVSISFFGPRFSEPKLLAYGYDFEQATHALRTPKYTPALPGDAFSP